MSKGLVTETDLINVITISFVHELLVAFKRSDQLGDIWVIADKRDLKKPVCFWASCLVEPFSSPCPERKEYC